MEIIRKLFTNYTIINEYTPNDILIKTTVKDLLKQNIINWEKNRDPDETRLDEIKEYYEQKETIINSEFHFYYDHKVDKLKCLDGIHRYKALTKIENLEFANDKVVILFIYFKKMDGALEDIFRTINKCIPVPDIFTSSEHSLNDTKIIQETVKEWVEKYSGHFSPSKDFRIPQMNRDFFTDFLTSIYNEPEYNLRSKTRLSDLIQIANQCVKEYVEAGVSISRRPIKFTEKQLEKCHKSGCYLFLYKDNVLKEYFFPLANQKIKNIN